MSGKEYSIFPAGVARCSNNKKRNRSGESVIPHLLFNYAPITGRGTRCQSLAHVYLCPRTVSVDLSSSGFSIYLLLFTNFSNVLVSNFLDFLWNTVRYILYIVN